MADMKYELETMYEIWNNRNGEHIQIGPDRDGLDLTEIRVVSDDDKIITRITLDDDQVPLLVQALQNRIKS